MFEKLKNLTKDSLIYGVGHIATRVLTFLLLPYYSFRLSPAEYGEVTLYYIFMGVVQTIFLYGMDISYLRYFNLAQDESERRRVTGTTVISSLISSLALTLLIVVIARPLATLLIHIPVHPEQVPQLIRICALILFFDTLSTFPFIILRGDRKPLRFIVIKTINVFVNLGLNILFLEYFDMTASGILWANLIASIIATLLLWPEVMRYWQRHVDMMRLKEMISFGLPNIPTYLFVMVTELADRKILELYKGLDQAGLYSAGYKLGMFMAVVTSAFRFAWQPFFLAHARDADAPRLFARVMTYYILITGFLFVGLTFFTPPLICHEWPGIGALMDGAYWAGLSVFPIILLAHIFDGVYANLMPGVYINKLTARLPWVTGAAALLNIVANLLLVPEYGMMAAAWVTLASFVLQALLLFVVVRSSYPVPYEWSRLTKISLACAIPLALSFVPALSGTWTKVGLFLLVIPLLLTLGFLDPRERERLRGLLKLA